MRGSAELDLFVRNLLEGAEPWIPIQAGIRGRPGVSGMPPGLDVNEPMGIDLIDMQPGTIFSLHTHPGAHILYVVAGCGTVTIGGAVYRTKHGDCYFVPAEVPHAVGAIERHQLLAVGFPYRALNDPRRLTIVDGSETNPTQEAWRKDGIAERG